MPRSGSSKRRAPRTPAVRKGQGKWPILPEEFQRRFDERFYDPAFESVRPEIERIREIAAAAHVEYRKSPRRRKAGAGFARPDYELPVEWLEARKNVLAAMRRQRDRRSRSRVLLICAAHRNDKTCPGEMSKTYRLVQAAQAAMTKARFEVDLLDLSTLTSEYGKVILPCKACVSTAMPLCHWPCSCYPNHALGQVNDWMNEIYARWAAAHGVMIITPVYWYQAPSGLKSMMDRLVCADGGNPDPTSTCLKDPKLAKELELAGWHYPRHLAGRAFSVIVHGDAEGADTLRRSLVDWLMDMELVPAGGAANFDRYIGYYEPYATSHDALDRDTALFQEVRNAALSLVTAVRMIRSGRREPDAEVQPPRPK